MLIVSPLSSFLTYSLFFSSLICRCFCRSGTIQADEIAVALVACGIRVTDKMLADLFAQTGKDIEDELTFIEFAEMMTGGSSDMIEGDSSGDPGRFSESERSLFYSLHVIFDSPAAQLFFFCV